MKKFTACFFVLTVGIFMAYPALAEPWKMTIEDSLMVTQNGYSDNWAGGESGSLSWAGNSNTLLEKQLRPKMNNKNTIKLSYGMTHAQDKITKKWGSPTKSTDLIDAESTLRFTLNKPVDPYTSLRFESQFFDASDTEKKRYINPTTFTESAGIAKVLLKQDKKEWITRLGGALKQKTDRQALDAGTGERKSTTSSSAGIQFISNYTSPFAADKITLTSNLTLYQAMVNSEAKRFERLPNENYWKAIDVNWENIVSISIAKYIMVNFYAQLLYDKEIARGGRLKESLAVGLTYKFSNL